VVRDNQHKGEREEVGQVEGERAELSEGGFAQWFGRYVMATQYFVLFWTCNDVYVRVFEYVGQVC
jgi:hypothetical protein